MSTNLTPPKHTPQNSFTHLINLRKWLTQIYNGIKQDKEYDDWIGYTLPEKVRNRYLQFFDDCKHTVKIKDIEIMIEYTNIMVEQYNHTQPIETKEVKEDIKPTVHTKEFTPISVRNYNPTQTKNSHWGPIDRTLLEHSVHKSLTMQSKIILTEIITLIASTNKEEIDYCYSHCLTKMSDKTFRNAIKELTSKGFISTSQSIGKSGKVKLSHKWIKHTLNDSEINTMNKKESIKQKKLIQDRNKLSRLHIK